MLKFTVVFKLKVIDAYKNHLPLLKVEGTKEESMKRNAQERKSLYDLLGIKGIENVIYYKNYTLKDKMKAVKLILKGKKYK